MSKIWKYEKKNFQFFQICRLEYPLKSLIKNDTSVGSKLYLPFVHLCL